MLNSAEPFSATADPLLDACLATGTDYVTGVEGVTLEHVDVD